MRPLLSFFLWAAVAVLGAAAFAVLALKRGEPVNAAWMLTAAFCTYAVGYRFYSKFIAERIFKLNDKRVTPAVRFNDGHDFVPTNKWIVFGHHFAAIAGAGPLVGPILAAQFGYLPGTLWIIIGVVLGGAVQDFVILTGSMRRDGKSLGQMAKEEVGPVAGWTALFAVLGIMVILIAVLALVVVKALAESPWGTVTLALTIPIALLMGVWMRFIRPGRVLEASVIGLVLLGFALWAGQWVAQSPAWAPVFTLDGKTLAYAVILYGFAASVLPVWVLLAPRDYLSAFVKVGTIAALALGIFLVLPDLQMPALTAQFGPGGPFAGGNGPVFAGTIFPFAFITIACGAISGFHALVSSGTTPKLLALESHARPIGYGSMVMESFVAVMAMIAACVLTPGEYFAINSPAGLLGADAVAAAAKVTSWGFTITPDALTGLAAKLGESSILSRTGGAPTLAVGMAHIFSRLLGGDAAMAFWYHFAIMFEALFILTTIDAGTRVGRFMLQDLGGHFWPRFGKITWTPGVWLASAAIVGGWGWFLVQGVIDPLGGIHTLWPLFGISNQLLAAVALCLGTTIIIKAGKARYAFVTLLPLAWLVTVTQAAAWEKLFSASPRISFLAHARMIESALASGTLPPGAKDALAANRMLFNDRLDAFLTAFFMAVIVIIVIDSVREWVAVLSGKKPLSSVDADMDVALGEAEVREA
jgi:carbon starvation protein